MGTRKVFVDFDWSVSLDGYRWNEPPSKKEIRAFKRVHIAAGARFHSPERPFLSPLSVSYDVTRPLETEPLLFHKFALLGETKEVCDKVALLDKGNLLKYVTVSDVEKISKNFRIEIEFTEFPTQSQLTSVLKIMDIKNVKQKSEHIIIVEFEGGLEQRAELLKQIQNLALKVVTFRTIDYDLEALYLDLVSESVR